MGFYLNKLSLMFRYRCCSVLWLCVVAAFVSGCLADKSGDDFSGAIDHVIYERCLDGKYHKKTATAEKGLVKCGQYSSKSCCSDVTAASLHEDSATPLYNFDYNVCGTMATKCRDYFLQNNCFYECSPNLWPWMEREFNSSFRNERFRRIPMCKSTCDLWWQACKAELTCARNWSKDFRWALVNGSAVNTCERKCVSFEEMYVGGAIDFCESVYTGDYRVVVDDGDAACMTFGDVARNKQTALTYAEEKGLICGSDKVKTQSNMIHHLRIQLGVLISFTIFIILLAVGLVVAQQRGLLPTRMIPTHLIR